MIRRLVSPVLLAATVGCTTLRPVARPQEFIPSRRPERIWVTRADNSKIVLDGPRLLGDTLVGWFRGNYQEILLPETRWITVREPAPRRTLLLAASFAGVGAGVLYMLAGSGPSGSGSQTEDPSNPSSLRYPRGLR
jgi:hypothetical protein